MPLFPLVTAYIAIFLHGTYDSIIPSWELSTAENGKKKAASDNNYWGNLSQLKIFIIISTQIVLYC